MKVREEEGGGKVEGKFEWPLAVLPINPQKYDTDLFYWPPCQKIYFVPYILQKENTKYEMITHDNKTQ